MGRPILRQKLVLFFGDIFYHEVSPKRDQTVFQHFLIESWGALRLAKIVACCLLVFPLVGTVSRSGPTARTQSLASKREEAPLRPAPSDALSREASGLFQAGRYQEALLRFEATRAVAVQARMAREAARALGNAGACQLALHQYRPALRSFLEAHRQAEAVNDSSAAAVLDFNIASL